MCVREDMRASCIHGLARLAALAIGLGGGGLMDLVAGEKFTMTWVSEI